MQISSLPASSTLGANDVLAIEVNGVTYKISGSALATALQSIGSPLAVNKGGTGLTANPSMLVNLASGNAANVLAASPRPGVTGALGLANGGLGKDFSAANNAGFHNSIFRGKNLGTALTTAQSTAITNGTFDDLFVGDYWVINGVTWRIADFDPYYKCGDTKLNTHHIAIVPDTTLYIAQWNTTDDTSAGYVGSAIRANIKAASASNAGAEEWFIAAFGSSHVLSYRALYPTTYANGIATAKAWTDARVELMNENEVYGTQVWSTDSLGFEVGISKRQFSIFRLNPSFLSDARTNPNSWWLRSLKPDGNVSFIYYMGSVDFRSASSTSVSVRPFALVA